MFGLHKKKEAALNQQSYNKRMLDANASNLALCYNIGESFAWWEVEQINEDLAAIDHYMKQLGIKEYTHNGLYFTQCPIYNCVIVKGLK